MRCAEFRGVGSDGAAGLFLEELDIRRCASPGHLCGGDQVAAVPQYGASFHFYGSQCAGGFCRFPSSAFQTATFLQRLRLRAVIPAVYPHPRYDRLTVQEVLLAAHHRCHHPRRVPVLPKNLRRELQYGLGRCVHSGGQSVIYLKHSAMDITGGSLPLHHPLQSDHLQQSGILHLVVVLQEERAGDPVGGQVQRRQQRADHAGAGERPGPEQAVLQQDGHGRDHQLSQDRRPVQSLLLVRVVNSPLILNILIY